eukprot:CAMPEP_0185745074 /NCGR_PEP_ID=MMETSP1174-20130828/3371_1 /TAXON_ID=35687 /ORGANISM="Dictyocha speculum, Strain CCMP1381" /LENGTH=344 /DNA_ID=CAMNT_0028418871 /DNA_START=26 /DNA_END=1060 /DNA_ORIENTATION=-
METVSDCDIFLSDSQISTFCEDGVLVVPNVLSDVEVLAAREGLHEHLLTTCGVDLNDLESTADGLRRLSSTNGSGGVLDIFYENWKMKIVEHPHIFRIFTQLWTATYGTEGDSFPCPTEEPIPTDRAFAYLDRVCFRVPNSISDAHATRRGKKSRPLQRSLTPHLDCCPETFGTRTQGKWRPIQAFVALTDCPQPLTMGGFECVKGFHRQFHTWAKDRPPQSNGSRVPCVGEFTPVRPREDGVVMEPVSCAAGSLVLWDNRIPHSNARHNTHSEAREVVYLGMLPYTKQNEDYAQHQLSCYRSALPPPGDQWSEERKEELRERDGSGDYPFSPLGRRLMAIDPW